MGRVDVSTDGAKETALVGEQRAASPPELRAIFHRLPEAVLVADDARRFVDANAAALALLGLTRDDLIGRRIDEMVSAGPAAEAFEVNWRALIESGSQDGEMLLELPGERRLRVAFRGAANVTPALHVFALRTAGGDFRQAQRLEEQARLQTARLRSLADASRAFARAGRDLEALLETVAREVAAAFGPEAGAGVGLSTRDGDALVRRKLHHPNPATLQALRAARVPANAGAALTEVLGTGHSVVIAFPPADATGSSQGGALTPMRAMMVTPLRGPDRIVGATWVSRERADQPFTPRDLAMLEDLAGHAALAVENARALRRARRTAKRTLLRESVMSAIAEQMTARGVAETVLHEARETIGATSGVLYHLGETGRELELLGASGTFGDWASGFPRLPLDAASGLAEAVREGRPILVPGSGRSAPRPSLPMEDTAHPLERRGGGAIPLLLQGRAVGSLGLVLDGNRLWRSEDVALLMALGSHAAQAIERARLYERAQQARRQAEEAVSIQEQSLALLDTLLGNAPVGLGFLDRDLRFRRINHVLSAINGRTREAHLGRNVRDVLPHLADVLEPVLRGVLSGGVPVVDFEVSGETPAAPGEVRHFLANFYPVRLDENAGSPIVGVGVVLSDVTAQRRSADAVALLAEAGAILSSSLDFERALSDLAHLVVPRLGDFCTVEVIHRGQARTMAMAHSDPAKAELAQELRRRYLPMPGARAGVFEVARRGQPVILPDVDGPAPEPGLADPEQAYIMRALKLRSAIIAPLVAGGRGFGALMVAASPPGRYGPGDLAVVEGLAHRAAMAVENARLYADAQDAIRVREEFLSIAGHELKTPLTALKLQLTGLLRRAQRSGDVQIPVEVGRLESTLRQGERLEKLVNQLLDVSRIAAGRLALDREETDLAALAREVLARLTDEQARGGSAVSLDAPGPVPGWWDRLRLDQVVSNLLSNAIKYGRGQPIDVRVYASGDDTAVLEVRDRGIGIAPESQARIFGRFERAVPERHYGGFGLGLWIVRQIVESHGGIITVESVPDEGSRFGVRLPRSVLI